MIRRQFIKRDDDISAKSFLRRNGALWCQTNQSTVAIGAKEDPLFIDLNDTAAAPFFLPLTFQFFCNGAVSERKNLKSPRTGNDRHRAVNEFMKPARLPDNFWPGLEHEMIRIAKHQLKTDRIDHFVVERLQRAICPNCYKIRRFNDAMRGIDFSKAR